jgi:hypothetical protein
LGDIIHSRQHISSFGGFLSLLTEAAQMTQRKRRRRNKLWVLGAASSSYELPPCVNVANSSKDFLPQLGKNHVYLFKNKNVLRKY